MDAKEYVCGLKETDLKYCKEVLNEDNEKRQIHINQIREWLKDNEHLNASIDGYEILRFLRSCKFNIEKTKNKIQSFYTFKSTAPEWFKNRDPLLPEMVTLLKIGTFLPLLERDDQGRLVVIIRTAAHDPSLQKQNDVFKIGMMVLDLALMAEDTSIYGVAAIFDMKGISLSHAKALTISIIKKAVASWQIYPHRLRTLEFINAPLYLDTVLNLFRLFMTQKMKERVHVYGCDLKSLHLVVPKEILPEEYGGTNGKIQDLIDFWYQKVTGSKQWLMETEKYIAVVEP